MRNSLVKRAVAGAITAGLLASASALPLVANAQSEDIVADYRATIDKLQNLREYNALMETAVADQKTRITDMQAELARIDGLKAAMPGLIKDMLGELETAINDDVPFRKATRAEKLGELKGKFGDLTPPDTDVETELKEYDQKVVQGFYKMLEAMQIENNYGRDIDAYRDSVLIDGEPVTVTYLMVGRIALFYNEIDEDKNIMKSGRVAMWDHDTKTWNTDLSATDIAQIQTAIAVASETMPPDLLLLPLPAPVDAG